MLNSETSQTIFQGGVTVTAIAFLRSAISHMIPYAIIAIPLIALDLLCGIRAAKGGEPKRINRRVRGYTRATRIYRRIWK